VETTKDVSLDGNECKVCWQYKRWNLVQNIPVNMDIWGCIFMVVLMRCSVEVRHLILTGCYWIIENILYTSASVCFRYANFEL